MTFSKADKLEHERTFAIHFTVKLLLSERGFQQEVEKLIDCIHWELIAKIVQNNG